jgi:uncharacterized membrane protein YfcA
VDIIFLVSVFLGAGILAGILAGFLGIGGGLVVVPLLALILPYAGVVDKHVMTMAVGTSLATIIFTTFSSLYSHQRRHNIIWPAVFSLFPGLMLGSLLGAAIGSQLDNVWMQVIFGSFAIILGLYTWFGDILIRPNWDYAASRNWLSLVGFFIASLSSIVGIGGGTLLGPWLTWLGLEAKRAVATSAACGFFIALFGSASYLITGTQAQDLPEFSLGYIYLPAFMCIIATSMLFAPVGAYLARNRSVVVIKFCMGLALFLAAGKMFYSLG